MPSPQVNLGRFGQTVAGVTLNGNTEISPAVSGTTIQVDTAAGSTGVLVNGSGTALSQVTDATQPVVRLYDTVETFDLTMIGHAGVIRTLGTHDIILATNGLTRMDINGSTGAVTFTGAVVFDSGATFDGAIKIVGSASTNNAELDITNTDASGGQWRIGDNIGTTAGTLTIYDTLHSAVRWTLSPAGAITINAPTTGNNALTVTGVSGTPSIKSVNAGVNDVNMDLFGVSAGGAVIEFHPNAGSQAGFVGLSGSAGEWTPNSAAGDFFVRVSGAARFSNNNGTGESVVISSTGAVNIAVPSSSSAPALKSSGPTGNWALQLLNPGTTNGSYGLSIQAGTSSSDMAIQIANQSTGASFQQIYGDGHGWIGPNGTNTFQWNTAGNYTLGAPTNGIALTVNGSNNWAISATSPNTAGSSLGLFVTAGTNNTDYTAAANSAAGVARWRIYGDGSGLLGPNATNNFQWNANGNYIIAAPASGTALTINGVSGGMVLNTVNPVDTPTANSVLFAGPAHAVRIGTISTASYIYGVDQTGTGSFQPLNIGASTLALGIGTTSYLSIGANGNVTISAPSSGSALTVNGNNSANGAILVNGGANQWSQEIIASSTSGQSYGMLIEAGTTSGDIGLEVANQSGGQGFFVIYGDGGTYVQNPPTTFTDRSGSGYYQVGYVDVPRTVASSNYTTVMSDRGKFIYCNAAGITITIAANSSVAYPIGTTITIIAMSGAATLTSSDTLTWCPTGTTGTRSLAIHAVATLIKSDSTNWQLTGVGIT